MASPVPPPKATIATTLRTAIAKTVLSEPPLSASLASGVGESGSSGTLGDESLGKVSLTAVSPHAEQSLYRIPSSASVASRSVIQSPTDVCTAFIERSSVVDESAAKEYSAEARLCGRGLYSALNTLYEVGVLDRRKDQKKYVYRLAKNIKKQITIDICE